MRRRLRLLQAGSTHRNRDVQHCPQLLHPKKVLGARSRPRVTAGTGTHPQLSPPTFPAPSSQAQLWFRGFSRQTGIFDSLDNSVYKPFAGAGDVQLLVLCISPKLIQSPGGDETENSSLQTNTWLKISLCSFSPPQTHRATAPPGNQTHF